MMLLLFVIAIACLDMTIFATGGTDIPMVICVTLLPVLGFAEGLVLGGRK